MVEYENPKPLAMSNSIEKDRKITRTTTVSSQSTQT